MNAQLQYQIEQFFYRKCELCDAQDWDAYLQLFAVDSEFHLPQWDSEHVYTRDPKREMSLIYYANRSGLEDRVFRLRTGKAASTIPMPRTLHLVSNLRIAEGDNGHLQVRLNWHTLFYRLATSEDFYGHATYDLKPDGDSWLIQRKHVLLLNDTINSVLDFYHL
ncbi:anthranilate 1,2-dioxygenase small subunit [Pseudomonas sp. TKO26]|uniref:Anthranilate 1,2-dioxygenase n=1 Tax=Pseudomonas saponiphila TaxID=556534 RepID=A0A1H4WNE4_9PSED|nr:MULTISPECIES: anthranilate 1,2-dioxygenase small subunit [Pseudomonas]PYY90386.1 anthranilate 1,2-dioxygenase small subunit [Pseudomonas sp. TKO30]PYY93258.1 anthranilate 1,2-dioxygenase small subunit [Pseudomonas sp. TKO29]PYY95486.1 anthranilate 1,2-dioxygenase small subunit [Pseudomonas sp. TKO26]PYZ01418.1 anthranilate 1,2-dioxygenase small subunit [Pseudomonas sp. TKO14]SEC94540.1 anthranilate 1,2-dioxygenase [Pseudomonas saponiphila]